MTNKLKSLIVLVTLMVIALFTKTNQVFAAPKIDMAQLGSIDISFPYGSTPQGKGEIRLYKIASFDENAKITYIDALKKYNFGTNESDYLLEYELLHIFTNNVKGAILTENIEPIQTITMPSTEDLSFKNLELGLYMIDSFSSKENGQTVIFPARIVPVPTLIDEQDWIYKVDVSAKAGGGIYGENTKDIEVVKIWDDEGYEQHRPYMTKIHLEKDGRNYQNVDLSVDDGWYYKFWAVDADATYSVREDSIEDYEITVRQEGNTFYVVNKYIGDDYDDWYHEDPDRDPEPQILPEPTDLSISKTVAGGAGDKDKEWTFKIILTNSPSTSIYDNYNYEITSSEDSTKTSGTINFVKIIDKYQGTIKLKHGQTVKIEGLPVGVTYQVIEVEANEDEYITEYTNEDGTLSEDNPVVTIKNTKYSKHDLQISKEVTGNEGDKNQKWTFDIVLTPEAGIPLNDSYVTIGTDNQNLVLTKQEDGSSKGSFTLKSGETITIKDLPENVSYEITEREANADGYITKVVGNSKGKLTTQNVEVINFVNTKYSLHDLTIEKTVAGSAGDKNKTWEFKVKLTPAADVELSSSYQYVGSSTISGVDKPADGTIELTNHDGIYEGSISLKHGQAITIKDIPERTNYEVIEVDANTSSYKTVSENVTGTLTNPEETVTFVNTKLGEKDLTISKKVIGDLGDKEKDWTFDITLIPDTNAYMKSSYIYEGSKSGTVTFTNVSGVYSGRITLKDGETVTIKGLPELTKYTVTEIDANNDGYTTTTSGNTNGTLNSDTPEVKFTNTKLSKNSITIVKEVQGSDGDKNKEWTFKITLTPPDNVTLKNSYSYIGGSTVDGVEAKAPGEITLNKENDKMVGTFTLKHGQSLTINDLPGGTKYKVEEVNTPDDYIKAVVGNTDGELHENTPCSVKFINKKPSKHDLTLGKEVQGGSGEKDKEWEFVITLTPDTYVTILDQYLYNGSKIGLISFTKQSDGTSKGTVTLKHGQSITIKGLPENTTYSISEVSSNENGYITKDTGNSTGKLTTKETIVNYNNTRLSKYDLSIKKTVTGNLGDKEKEWTFNIELTSPNVQELSNSYKYEKQDHTTGDIELIKEATGVYKATVNLKDGETITIKDLPEGTKYSVTEKEFNENGYQTFTSDNTVGVLDGETPVVEFYNKNYSYHSLKIEKNVRGNNGETDKLWTFKIILTLNADVPEKTVYSYIGENIESGTIEFKKEEGKYVGEISLKAGQKVTIEDIPYGTEYEVSEIEENKNGYVTTYKNNQGIIEDDVEVLIVNERHVDIPKTLDDITKYIAVFGIGIVAFLGTIFIYMKRGKKDHKKKV